MSFLRPRRRRSSASETDINPKQATAKFTPQLPLRQPVVVRQPDRVMADGFDPVAVRIAREGCVAGRVIAAQSGTGLF
jgi:hypothetical protein